MIKIADSIDKNFTYITKKLNQNTSKLRISLSQKDWIDTGETFR